MTGAYEGSECNTTQNWVIVNASHQRDLSSICLPEGAHERKITPAPTSQPLTEDPSQKLGVLPSGSLAKAPAVSTLGKLAPTPHSRRETMMICVAGVPVFAPQCHEVLCWRKSRDSVESKCVTLSGIVAWPSEELSKQPPPPPRSTNYLPIMIKYECNRMVQGPRLHSAQRRTKLV